MQHLYILKNAANWAFTCKHRPRDCRERAIRSFFTLENRWGVGGIPQCKCQGACVPFCISSVSLLRRRSHLHVCSFALSSPGSTSEIGKKTKLPVSGEVIFGALVDPWACEAVARRRWSQAAPEGAHGSARPEATRSQRWLQRFGLIFGFHFPCYRRRKSKIRNGISFSSGSECAAVSARKEPRHCFFLKIAVSLVVQNARWLVVHIVEFPLICHQLMHLDHLQNIVMLHTSAGLKLGC